MKQINETNTQLKVEDVFEEKLGKESISSKQRIQLNNVLAKLM